MELKEYHCSTFEYFQTRTQFLPPSFVSKIPAPEELFPDSNLPAAQPMSSFKKYISLPEK